MVSKFVIVAVAVILASPICVATAGSAASGSSTGGAGGGGHSNGSVSGGGGAGHVAGAKGGRAAEAKHSEGEHTASKSPGKDHRPRLYRREPDYGVAEQPRSAICTPAADMDSRSWFDCNEPTKSLPGHKS